MGDPLSIAVNLVSAITARIKDVKTNQEGCKLLEGLTKKTLAILQQMEETQFDPSLEAALQPLNDALTEAQNTIGKCCKTNIFQAMLYSKSYESALKHAATKLQYALLHIPLASHRMDSDIKSNLFDLSCQLHHAKFEERAAMAHQTIELKEKFEQAFFNSRIVNEKLKQMIRMLVKKHVAGKEIQAQMALLITDLAKARRNKESQMEFELSQIIEVMAESLKNDIKTSTKSQDLESCFLCPITKDFMRDPVILVETGATYDCSSITEWFERGHGHDPLSNVKLASKELVSDHMLRDACLTFLGEPTSSSSAYIPTNKVHVPSFKSGLYEGHGQLVFSSFTVLIAQTLILGPQGEVNGYAIYKNQEVKVVKNVLESGIGKWDAKNLELSYQDNAYFFNGSIDHTIIEGESTVKWNGKVTTLIGNIEDGTFDILYRPPCVSLNIRPRLGMYQMENAYITTNENINNVVTLLLSFQVNLRVDGYMWINTGTSLPKYIGTITNGRWKSKQSVKFSVHFPLENNLLDSPQTLPTNWLFILEIEGNFTQDKESSYSFFNAKITKRLNEEIESNDETYFTLFDDVKCLQFPCIREASIPWHHIHQDLFGLFPSTKSYDSRSRNDSISTKVDINYGVLPYNLNVWKRTSLYVASQQNHINVVRKNIIDNANLNVQDKDGASLLYKASQENAIDVVKELLAYGASINLSNVDGWSPLHISSQSNSINVVRELIAHGACVNLQGKDGCTPLHVASDTNCINVVKELIANGANVDVSEKSGWTPLLIASFSNLVDVVQELITHGANVNFQTNEGEYPLYIASQNSCIDVIKELIAHGAKIDLQDNDGTSSLHVASSCNSIDVVKELIANNANIDLKNNDGWTSLHFAVYEKFDEIVKILLANGASRNCQENNGWTPLHYASQMNLVDIVKELISHGAKIDLQAKNGATPLYVAIQHNSIDMAKELITHGASIDLQEKDGWAPLHVASQNNSIVIVKVNIILHFYESHYVKELIDHGANVNIQEKNGWTPLHTALANNSIDVAKELIANDASIDLQNKNGESPLDVASSHMSIKELTSHGANTNLQQKLWKFLWPSVYLNTPKLIKIGANINLQLKDSESTLHNASKFNSIEVAKELIAHGANIDFQKNDGASPLDIAAQKNSIEVAKELIAHGANIDLQDNDGASPLHIASLMNCIDVAKELIANGAIIDLQDKKGVSPLHIASQNNSVSLAKVLIAHGANFDLQDNGGAAPLHIAILNNSTTIAKELIAHGANINLQDKERVSLLHLASLKNSIDVAKELISNGANIDLQYNDGWSSLHIASQINSISVAKVNIILHFYESHYVKELIDHGANLNVQNENGSSPLHIALQNNCISIANELIANGANVDLQDNDGWSSLHCASQMNSIDVIKALIAYGANLNLQTNDRESSLHIASQNNYIGVAMELINYGANLNLQNKNGASPLYLAVLNKSIDVAKELIARNADIDLPTYILNIAPIHIASRLNYIDILQELIDKKAKLNTQSNEGCTPLHMAAARGFVSIVKVLLKHGASKRIKNVAKETPLDVVCSNTSGPFDEEVLNELKSLLKLRLSIPRRNFFLRT
eukprot:g5391.t1